MSYTADINDKFKKWTCKQCLYVNKRYLCCGRYVYGNRDETKCVFCGDHDEKSKSDDSKQDTIIQYTDDDEKNWLNIIHPDSAKYVDSALITPQSYKLEQDFINPAYDLNPQNATFKAECIDIDRLTETEFIIILKRAKSIYQNKDISTKFTANFNAGINVDIKKGDPLGIEHIFAILLYTHFPKYVARYRVSLPSKFYHFYRFLYEVITYFGRKMPADMVVYVGLSGGLNAMEEREEKKDTDSEGGDQRRNDEWMFFNTGFLSIPLSACRETHIFSKGTLILSLKAQFLNEFNDTKYFDLAPFCCFAEKDGKNEVVFLGEFGELSVVNVCVAGDASYDFNAYFEALNLWQMLSTGFAGFEGGKYNLEVTDESQATLVKLLNGDKDTPKYIQQVFRYYNESKMGQKYHRMYGEFLDIDFSKICVKVGKNLSQEMKALLFNDDVSDVDAAKIKRIFSKGKKYRNTAEKEKQF